MGKGVTFQIDLEGASRGEKWSKYLSAGFIIQSSPGGFGLDWIKNSIGFWTGLDQKCAMCIPYLETLQFLPIVL